MPLDKGIIVGTDGKPLEVVTAMTGATSVVDGAGGTVPTPLAGDQSEFLRGDGVWALPDPLSVLVFSGLNEIITQTSLGGEGVIRPIVNNNTTFGFWLANNGQGGTVFYDGVDVGSTTQLRPLKTYLLYFTGNDINILSTQDLLFNSATWSSPGPATLASANTDWALTGTAERSYTLPSYADLNLGDKFKMRVGQNITSINPTVGEAINGIDNLVINVTGRTNYTLEFAYINAISGWHVEIRPDSVDPNDIGVWSNTNTTKDLNVINLDYGNLAPLFGSEDLNLNPALFTADLGGEFLTLNSDGVIEVDWHIHQFTTSPRTNAAGRMRINTTPVGNVGATGYIRDTSGHQESSISGSHSIQVTAGDTLAVGCRQEAAGGVVNMPVVGTSTIKVKYLRKY